MQRSLNGKRWSLAILALLLTMCRNARHEANEVQVAPAQVHIANDATAVAAPTKATLDTDAIEELNSWVKQQGDQLANDEQHLMVVAQLPRAAYVDIDPAESLQSRAAWECPAAAASEVAEWETLVIPFVEQERALAHRKQTTTKDLFHACTEGSKCKIKAWVPCANSRFAIIQDSVERGDEATWLLRREGASVHKADPSARTQDPPLRWVGAADLDKDGVLDLVLQQVITGGPCGPFRHDCYWQQKLALVIWSAESSRDARVENLPQQRLNYDSVALLRCDGIGLGLLEGLQPEDAPRIAFAVTQHRVRKDPKIATCLQTHLVPLRTRRALIRRIADARCTPQLAEALRAAAHPRALDADWVRSVEEQAQQSCLNGKAR
jgi:hypothetical protein